MRTSSKKNACILRRAVPSRAKAVERLCAEVRAFLHAHDLFEAAFAVELAARECLNNALEHGSQGRAGRAIRMELRVGRVWIQLSVADQGPGFQRRRNPTLAAPGSTGGRGLAICSHYADRTAFNRRGNRITLWLSKARKE